MLKTLSLTLAIVALAACAGGGGSGFVPANHSCVKQPNGWTNCNAVHRPHKEGNR